MVVGVLEDGPFDVCPTVGQRREGFSSGGRAWSDTVSVFIVQRDKGVVVEGVVAEVFFLSV